MNCLACLWQNEFMNTNPCFSGLLIVIYILPRILVHFTVEMCFHTVFLLTVWSSDIIDVENLLFVNLNGCSFVFIIYDLQQQHPVYYSSFWSSTIFYLLVLILEAGKSDYCYVFCLAVFIRRFFNFLNEKWPKYLTLLNAIL